MNTDRNLLELAAKAAGIELGPWVTLGDQVGWFAVRDKSPITGDGWNPLADDGDALRLAVKLGLLVDMRYTAPETARYNAVTYWPTPMHGVSISFGDREMDASAATRRAIVRAAAELGSTK